MLGPTTHWVKKSATSSTTHRNLTEIRAALYLGHSVDEANLHRPHPPNPLLAMKPAVAAGAVVRLINATSAERDQLQPTML